MMKLYKKNFAKALSLRTVNAYDIKYETAYPIQRRTFIIYGSRF